MSKKRKADDAKGSGVPQRQKEILFPKQLNPIPYGSKNSVSNTCFRSNPPPSFVDYATLKPLEMPPNFHLKAYGDQWAKGKERKIAIEYTTENISIH